MGDLVFNIAKGRVAELHSRVDNNDPANSAIIVVPVSRGAVTDATLKDFDTLSAVLAGGVTERNTGGWTRKTLTDADTPAVTPDDTNDRQDVGTGLAAQTWTAVTTGAVTDLLLCYDNDTTGGTDANLVPMVCLDFPITPDGSDVQWQPNARGYYTAS